MKTITLALCFGYDWHMVLFLYGLFCLFVAVGAWLIACLDCFYSSRNVSKVFRKL